MKAIVKWTLIQRKISTLWWSFGIAAFIFINMVFYPSFRDQAAELQKSFESMPEAAVQLFGGSTDFFSPIGFLNSQIFFIMLPLILGILAISLGSSLLAREEQDGTIETLLSRPISRAKFLLAKSLAGVIILTGVSLIGLITTLVMCEVVDLDISALDVVGATLTCFMMVLCFGAIGLLFTAIGKTRGASLGIASGVALIGYIISSLSGTVSWLETPSKLLPFHYYNPEAVFRHTYDWVNVIYFVVVLVACALMSLIFFRRRDIY